MRNSVFKSNKRHFHIYSDFQVNPFLKDLDWLFLQNQISKLSFKYHIEIQAFVMMDTHIHLLVATFETNENFFLAELKKQLNSREEVEQSIEYISNYSQYLNAYKYIYRNPVEANICNKAENYKYSSLFYLIGKSKSDLAIHDQLGLIQNPIHILKWINTDIGFKVSRLSLSI
ncbi:hypothetical protein K2P97_01020 [bacterium]|nr:hypothetical protein [bacterium]